MAAGARRAHTTRSRALQAVGLKVSDVVVLIDRQQGGEAHLASKVGAATCNRHGRLLTCLPLLRAGSRQGLKLHAALPITVMLDTLVAHGKVAPSVAADVRQFIADNQTAVPTAASALGGGAGGAPAAPPVPKRLSYGERATHAANPAGAPVHLACRRGRRR